MKKKNKKILLTGVCAAVILAGGLSVYAYQSDTAKKVSTVYKEVSVERGNLTVGVTESGSVSIGILEQQFPLEESTSGSTSQSQGMGSMSGSSGSSSSGVALEVEEVYVSVGQKVSEGDALLKISSDSIEKYREALEEAVNDASVSLTEAKLSAQKQQLNATYSYNTSIAKGTVAEATYNATLDQLQSEVDSAQDNYDNCAAAADYYWNLVTNGDDSYSDKLEEAQKKCEEAKAKLTLAQNNYTTKSLEAKKTYEETLLSYSNASGQYAIDVNGIDSSVDTATEKLSEAQETLAEFEAFIGDGIVYAENEGTVLSVGYAEGDSLSSDTNIVTYSDSSAVTMTVSVSQEDISEITVGDSVLITLTAYEGEEFSGVVSGMNTSSSSGSSTVSYDVTVTFSGDVSKIYADMTGNVTFIQKQIKDVVYVSNKAIINEGITSYVKVKQEDGSFAKVEVVTGFSDGINVEIKSGLKEGDIAIIESRVVNE